MEKTKKLNTTDGLQVFQEKLALYKDGLTHLNIKLSDIPFEYRIADIYKLACQATLRVDMALDSSHGSFGRMTIEQMLTNDIRKRNEDGDTETARELERLHIKYFESEFFQHDRKIVEKIQKEKERNQKQRTRSYFECVLENDTATQCELDLLNGDIYISEVPFVYRTYHAYLYAFRFLSGDAVELALMESLLLDDIIQSCSEGMSGREQALRNFYQSHFLDFQEKNRLVALQ